MEASSCCSIVLINVCFHCMYRSILVKTSGLKRLLITCLPCVGKLVCVCVCVCVYARTRACGYVCMCVCHSTEYLHFVYPYRQFDLRFTVIHDRFDHDKYKVHPYVAGTFLLSNIPHFHLNILIFHIHSVLLGHKFFLQEWSW